MGNETDFDIADREAGSQVLEPSTVTDMVPRGTGQMAPASDIIKLRDRLIRQYHNGADGLVKRLQKAGLESYESLLSALIEEIIVETDHLLGNELVATENGELRDASVISFKRSEVLEKAVKAVQGRQQFEKSGIDVDSPAMREVFTYFMQKVHDALTKMGAAEEMRDLFFQSLVAETMNWKKDLKDRIQFVAKG